MRRRRRPPATAPRPWSGATVVRATALNRRKQTGDSVISAASGVGGGGGGAARKGDSRERERGSHPPALRAAPRSSPRDTRDRRGRGGGRPRGRWRTAAGRGRCRAAPQPPAPPGGTPRGPSPRRGEAGRRRLPAGRWDGADGRGPAGASPRFSRRERVLLSGLVLPCLTRAGRSVWGREVPRRARPSAGNILRDDLVEELAPTICRGLPFPGSGQDFVYIGFVFNRIWVSRTRFMIIYIFFFHVPDTLQTTPAPRYPPFNPNRKVWPGPASCGAEGGRSGSGAPVGAAGASRRREAGGGAAAGWEPLLPPLRSDEMQLRCRDIYRIIINKIIRINPKRLKPSPRGLLVI